MLYIVYEASRRDVFMQKVYYTVVLALAVGLLASCDEAAPTAVGACASADVGDWEFLGLAADTLSTVSTVAMSSYDHELLLVGTSANFGAGISGWLFRSEDDGQTWQPVLASGLFFGGFRDVDFDFANGAVAYSLPYGVSKSVDEGRTWFPSEDGIRIDFDTRVGAFLQDRTDSSGQTLLVGTHGFFTGHLYRSTDGAETWVDLVPSIEECQEPDAPDNCYLFSGVISLAAATSDPTILYAGTNQAGFVLRSVDGGLTWELRSELASLARSLAVDIADPDVVYVVSGGDPAAHRSEDGGATFAPFVEGLPNPSNGGRIVQEPSTGVLYHTSSSGGEWALWRRQPVEGTWAEVPTPVIGIASNSVLYLTSDGWLYVGGSGLWRVDTRMLTSVEPGPCEP